MKTLFGSASAVVSPCGAYRYLLTRTWYAGLPSLCWCLLNPSKADASVDDPTLRKVVGFARRWGYGGATIVNLFALRSTDPRRLRHHADPIGPENDRHLREAVAGQDVVAGWGKHGVQRGRDKEVLALIRPLVARLDCVGMNLGGSPKHPLFSEWAALREKYPGD